MTLAPRREEATVDVHARVDADADDHRRERRRDRREARIDERRERRRPQRARRERREHREERARPAERRDEHERREDAGEHAALLEIALHHRFGLLRDDVAARERERDVRVCAPDAVERGLGLRREARRCARVEGAAARLDDEEARAAFLRDERPPPLARAPAAISTRPSQGSS